MSSKYTYAQIANDFSLWCEFVDVDATMTESEFNSPTVEQKIQIQVDAFGPEVAAEDE